MIYHWYIQNIPHKILCMDVVKFLESMPDEVAEMHLYVSTQLSGMFSECKLKKFDDIGKQYKFVMGEEKIYNKCTIIEYPYVYARFMAFGIEEKKLSFGHEGIDEFFHQCYFDSHNLRMKRPDLYQKIKKYLNSIQFINEKKSPYFILGDMMDVMKNLFFDKIIKIIDEDKKSDKAILLFDTDILVINRRIPALEAKIQVAIDIPQTVCQASVEISKEKYRNKGYRVLQGSEFVE